MNTFKTYNISITIIFLLLTATSLFAQKKTIQMKWKPVKGALGYKVQIKDSFNKVIIDKRTKTSNISIAIHPGLYLRRISSINKFNKTGRWTKWNKFKISAVAKPNIQKVTPNKKENSEGFHSVTVNGKNFMKQSQVFIEFPGKSKQEIPFEFINSNQLIILLKTSAYTDGKYSISIINPKGLHDSSKNALTFKGKKLQAKESTSSIKEITNKDTPINPKNASHSFWPTLIPGAPGIQRNSKSGYLWASAFASTLALSYTEYKATQIRREQIISDPLFIAFQNPLVLINISQTLLAEETLLLGLASNHRSLSIEKKYLRHKRNHLLWSNLAWGSIVSHFIWENKEHMRWSHLIPGLTHHKNNKKLRGNIWIGSMGFLFASLGYNYNDTKELQAQSAAYIPNAIATSIIMETVLANTSSEVDVFLLESINKKREMNSKILSHKNLEKGLSFSLMAIYLLQMVDATYVQSGQSVQVHIRNENFHPMRVSSKQNLTNQVHEIEWRISF